MISGFAVSIGIVATLGLVAFYFVKDVVEASRYAAHSQQVLMLVERTRTLVTEVQLARVQRDSVHDPASQARYAGLRSQLYHVFSVLDSMVRGESGQQRRVAMLRIALAEMDSASVQFSSDQEAAYEFISQIERAENNLKKERQALITDRFYDFITISLVLIVVWVATMLIMLILLNRNLKARDKAETRLTLAAVEIERLYDEAPCGYLTVNSDGIVVNANRTLLLWLGYGQESVIDKKHILDLVSGECQPSVRRVFFEQKAGSGELEVDLLRKNEVQVSALISFTRRQTQGHDVYLCSVLDNTARKKAELEAREAYKELESFSYSVSHDLRAPLRSINGYGQILMEDYGDKLDDEGRRVVGVIINNGKRMGQLIDDLLDFSRASRKEISQARIDMGEVVRSISSELMEREGDREIELKIADLATAFGDISMIRQVWVNLISNALKYSRKRKSAVIEIGCFRNGDNDVYFIKDNGAGFSMEYYDKLFGVFQRLHKWQDFEGTGVGLAIVKRVIERHGGRIWAEAKLGEGATFYYSMPSPVNKSKEMQAVGIDR